MMIKIIFNKKNMKVLFSGTCINIYKNKEFGRII
jgi:hypothetical protein